VTSEQNETNRPIHLIVQYFRAATPERQAEIDTCLRENLQNPLIAMVHLLTEEEFALTEFPNLDKVRQIAIGERLTYERAFKYANAWPEPVIWMLSNADIYFDDTLRFLSCVDFTDQIFALTRHNVMPDGSLEFMPPEYAHGSQDAWIFAAPVPVERLFSSFYLGVPGCDHRIAYEFIIAGYLVLNPSLKIIVRHLDNFSDIDVHARTNQYVSLMNEEAYSSRKAASPPYQYFIYPTGELIPSIHSLYSEKMHLSEAKSKLEADKVRLESEKVHLEAEKSQLLREIYELKRGVQWRDQKIHALENSLSWRVTAPLRRIGHVFSISAATIEHSDSTRDKSAEHTKIAELFVLNNQEPSFARSSEVDVIIPVYNGYDKFVSCIKSVLNNSNNCSIIIIDDSSTDPRITGYISTLRDVPENGITLIRVRNETNIGFVRTVNKAYKYTNNNFIILNSDTEVPSGWLDRIIKPINESDVIATVTPFSNAATILSFPAPNVDNELYHNLNIDSLDGYFSRYLPSAPLDIPTGVGFCMAVSRMVVEKIGLFDEDTFDRGYGEENDFCMRAVEAGYRNVLIPNLFVYHKHGGSFGRHEKEELLRKNSIKLATKHPRYSAAVNDFIMLDPLAAFRTFLKLVISSREGKARPTVLLLDFNLGGGSNLYSRNLVANLERTGHRIVVLEFRHSMRTFHLEMNLGDSIEEMEFTCEFPIFIKALSEKLAIDSIVVSQLITWPDTEIVLAAIRQTGIPYLVLMHDYFMLCPNWTLFDFQEKFCGIPEDPEICARCLENIRHMDIPLSQHTHVKRIEPWRIHAGEYLAAAAKVICFSEASQQIVRKAYPWLDNVIVNEHSIPEQHLFSWKQRSYDAVKRLTIAVIGGMNVAKGSKFLDKLINTQKFKMLPVRIVLLGEINPLPNYVTGADSNFILHGSYNRQDLGRLLGSYDVSMVMIPSQWPETFCYTASEALLLGYPVLCFDVGAQADRIRRNNCGWVVKEPFVENAVAEIRTILANPDMVSEKSLHACNYIPHTSEQHLSQFNKMLDCA